jgi:lipopolysaccharide export system permease protein
MKIFKQAMQRELSRTFGATLVVLVTIVMTMMLIRTLGLASKGAINPQEVLLIMSYSVLGHTPTILALSLFITVVSTLARMIGDNEVVIWLSSGQSILGFLKPLFRFATPIFITIALMVFMIWPWANTQMKDLRERFEQRGDIERVIPGEFQESASGRRVIYVDKSESKDPNHLEVNNVFMAYFDKDKEVITSARSGHTKIIEGDKFIVLNNGQQLSLGLIDKNIKLVEFEELGTRVQSEDIASVIAPPNTRSSLTLINDPKLDNLGELSWRLGIVLTSINLLLLGLASASIKPRQAKGAPLLLAILIFVSYYNFINVGQNWIASGRASFASTLLVLHGGIFLLALLWLLRRQSRPSA